MKRATLVLLLSGLMAATVVATQAAEFDFYQWGPYQQGIPRPDEVLGYAIGTRHTFYHQMENYLRALERSTPRVRLLQYGESYEGRALYLVLISSEENLKRVEEIRAATARLADPRRVAGREELAELLRATPATVWLNYANDGNESAAFEAGLQTSYQLAAGEDERTRRIRERVLTILIPAHNPDSHERFVAWYGAAVQGPGGNPDPNGVEHNRDWLMDSNDTHFHIDPNRDAIALSQQETRAIVEQLYRWNPQVFIDHHGNPPVFFFPPPALPVNTNLPEETYAWMDKFGRAIAAEFDRFRWSYMSREVYDLHYPGYFDSYPSLNGAIGMTFETDGGGAQGLQLERPDGTRSSLRGGVAKHFVGGLAVLATAAEQKEPLLQYTFNFRQSGLERVNTDNVKQYVLVEGENPAAARELVNLLLQHRIEVHRAPAPFSSKRARNYFNDRVEAREFPAGSFVVYAGQPQNRLLTALLEQEAELNDEFLKEARERMERNQRLGKRAQRERLGFYDVTSWSLPLSFGVEAYRTEERTGGLEPVTRPLEPGAGVVGGEGRYGYVFRADSMPGMKLLAQLLKEQFNASVSRAELQVEGETYPAGTILLRTERNPETLHGRIRALAEAAGVSVRAVSAAWTEEGPALGSRLIEHLKPPRIAIAAYEPTNGRAYGHLWFLFEQMLDYPFTPIRTDALASVDLREYDVLIFPHGDAAGYERRLGPSGIERIKAWIEAGGVFIGIKGGAAFATRKDVAWTSARLHGQPLPEQEKKNDEERAALEKEVWDTPGAILKLELNDAHFLALGFGDRLAALHNSDLIFTRSREGTNVATYAEDSPRLSGFIWEDTLERIKGTPYLIDENLGRGHVILFADDPAFRLLWPQLARLLLNSAFLAPSLH